MEYGEEDGVADEDDEDDRSMSLSPSPLAAKKKGPQIIPAQSKRKSNLPPQPIIEKRAFVPDPPMLPSDTEEAELTETEMDDESSRFPPSVRPPPAKKAKNPNAAASVPSPAQSVPSSFSKCVLHVAAYSRDRR